MENKNKEVNILQQIIKTSVLYNEAFVEIKNRYIYYCLNCDTTSISIIKEIENILKPYINKHDIIYIEVDFFTKNIKIAVKSNPKLIELSSNI